MWRLNWTRRKCSEFVEQERQSLREFVSGESHYFEGRRYRMDVVEVDGLPCVSLLKTGVKFPWRRPDSATLQRDPTMSSAE